MIDRLNQKIDRYRTLIIVLVVSLLCVGVKLNPMPTGLEKDEISKSFSLVDTLRGTSAMNHFLLLRKGESLCALRFTSFRKEKVTSRAAFSDKNEKFNFYAEYEWFFTRRADGRFTGEGVETGNSKLDSQPGIIIGIPFLNDIGHYIPQGESVIKCGDIDLPWYYPNMFQYEFNRKGWPMDMETEHGPTRWLKISKVNALHPDIIWYGHSDYVPGNDPPSPNYISNTMIPVEDLPPFDLGSPKTNDPPN